MKLYNYLNEQRSNIINIDDFVSNVKQKCKKTLSLYQQTGKFIYRGLDNVNPVLSIDSSKSTSRVSKNTANYYTILFDYVLPSWNGWPMRSKSIICTTNYYYARTYGDIFITFPTDNCNIATCSTDDFWGAFKKYDRIGTLDDFNYELNILLGKLNLNKSDEPSVFRKTIHKLNDIISKDETSDLDGISLVNRFKNSGHKEFISFLDDIFNPSENGNKIYKPGDRLMKDKEMWMVGESYLVKYDYFKDNLIMTRLVG